MSNLRRIMVVAATGLLATLGLASPSQAALVTGVSAGVLTVTGDASNDSVNLTCSASNVKINGANPGTGAATCASITSIVVNGGTGDDSIVASGVTTATFTSIASVVISGEDGADVLLGSEIADTLNGGNNDDYFVGSPGNDLVDGGADNDTVNPQGTPVNVTLTNSAFTATGQGTDTISNIEKGDLLTAGGTVDASGFSGSTTMNGSSGSETFIGGSGSDDFLPQGAADTVTGNGGNDLFELSPDASNDSLDGGSGIDRLTDQDSTITLTDFNLGGPLEFDGLGSIEQATLSVPADGSVNASGFTGSTTITGSTGDEHLVGGHGKDHIDGQGGNDVLKGGAAADTLLGKAGNDTLVGGPGNDVCKGGPGKNKIKSC